MGIKTYINLLKIIDLSYLVISKLVTIFAAKITVKENEGDVSPLFLYFKMNQEKVSNLVKEALEENESLFLISLQFLANNKIQLVVDGDSGVSLKEIVRISRHVEHNLDREEEDFALEVTSPDIKEPLVTQRQYLKNINRILKVKTEDQEYEGVLTKADDEAIVLQWKTREPKPIGKGKVTVEKTVTIVYKDIKEAKVKIVF